MRLVNVPQVSRPRTGVSRRSILLSASAAAASAGSIALTACGATGGSTEPAVTIGVKGPAAVEFGHNYATGPRWEIVQAAAKRFQEEHPNIKIDITPVPGDYYSPITARLAGGSAPDVILGSGSTFLSLLDQGSFGSIDPYLKADRSFDLRKYTVQPDVTAKDGKNYGLPFVNTTGHYAYNKAMFRRAGVAEPNDKWTWDDLLNAARKLTAGTDPTAPESQWGFLVGTGFENNLLPFIWSAGGDYISKDLKRTTMDAPATIEALQFVADLFLRHKVVPPSNATLSPAGFPSGRIGIISAGSNQIGSNYLPQIANNFEWDLTWIPRHPKTGKRTGSFNTTPAWFTNPDKTTSKNPDAAWLLLRHAVSPYFQGLIASSKLLTPALISAATDKATYLAPPPASMHVVAESTKTSESLRFHKSYAAWRDAVTQAIAPIFTGAKSALDAAREANTLGDAILRGN